MTKERVYLIAGGGTSGHVNPALALAEVAMLTEENSRFIFLVTADGVEKELAEMAGYETEVIRAAALPRSLGDHVLNFVLSDWAGFREARRLIRKYRPRAVIGTGGYVCSPLILAAQSLHIPYLLHEQNAVPGRSNRLFAKHAAAICVSFSGSERFFKSKGLVVCTGNPVREVFFTSEQKNCRKSLNLPEESFVVLLMGGSLGSRKLNEAVSEMVESEAWLQLLQEYPEIRLALSSGRINFESFENRLSDKPGIFHAQYLDSRLWLPACDLFIGRAGASTCLEVAACGKASILIPFPLASDDHQTVNANLFVEHGAAIMQADSEVSASWLCETIGAMARDRVRLQTMAEHAKTLARPQAAKDLFDTLKKIRLPDED